MITQTSLRSLNSDEITLVSGGEDDEIICEAPRYVRDNLWSFDDMRFSGGSYFSSLLANANDFGGGGGSPGACDTDGDGLADDVDPDPKHLATTQVRLTFVRQREGHIS